MKKIFLSILIIGVVILFNNQNAKAQYSKSDKMLNVGIGLNGGYGGGIPLAASLEVGVTDDISAGGSLGYLSHSYGGGYGYSVLYIGGRGSYHVNKLLNLGNDKVDLYVGAGLGYRNFHWKDTYGVGYNQNNSGIYLAGFVGGRYYFQKNMAAYAELGGGGYSNASVGLTFRF
jgi:hypothetical protein